LVIGRARPFSVGIAPKDCGGEACGSDATPLDATVGSDVTIPARVAL